ncbi:MAG: hypothetical protein H6Q67_1268 [Firmicutes bacterium]|nr:hypothetical protein [Bacillota bacterium]
MNIRQLQYFISVAENLSFTAAAKSLYISQPSLSQQIAELERHIGVKLFYRDRHCVRLTAAGTSLLKEAKILVAKAEEAIKITREAETGIVGRLSIGFLGAAERIFLPQLLAAFRKKYPNVELNLHHFNSFSELDKTLLQGEVDIGVTLKSNHEMLPLLSWKPIYTDTLSIVLSSSHPLIDKVARQISLLDGEPIYILDRDVASRCFDTLLQICADRRINPIIRLVPHMQTVLLMVESGAGFAILPRLIPETYASPRLKCFNIEGIDTTVDVIAAWKTNSDNPSIALFIEELENMLPLSYQTTIVTSEEGSCPCQ